MSFDRLAPHYPWMERVLAGRRLQRARTAWLDELAGCERILVAGVGHGPFLRACAARFPAAEIVAVDASARMLAQAERGLRRGGIGTGRVELVQAILPQWTPPADGFDAIVTNFFLDCFPPDELGEVVDVLARAARERARWLVTDFAIPAAGWRRQRARAIHWAMYAFFQPATRLRARRLTPPDEHLSARGFRLAARRTTEWGLIQADLWTRADPG